MSFPEHTKQEVLKKAAYSCCLCQKPSVSAEVHHIIPEGCGGGDDIDNAAPLCPTHHSDLGANPEKRKRITAMRDWWYETVDKMYSTKVASPADFKNVTELLEKINQQRNETQRQSNDALNELKTEMKRIVVKLIDDMTPATSDITVASILSTATKANVLNENEYFCGRCHNPVNMGDDWCPKCGYCQG